MKRYPDLRIILREPQELIRNPPGTARTMEPTVLKLITMPSRLGEALSSTNRRGTRGPLIEKTAKAKPAPMQR
jgi:hypothetical protein